MSYDLVVGKSNKAIDSPLVIGCVEFAELAEIGRLSQRIDSFFLRKIADPFNDAKFSPSEVEEAMADLHPLLLEGLAEGERVMLHKLLAVLSFASAKKQSLFGVAD